MQQVFAALHYYVGHRQEIDALIAANRIPAEWAGKRFDPSTRQGKLPEGLAELAG